MGLQLNPVENVLVIATSDDLPDELSRFVIYHLLYDPGDGAGLYYTADESSLTKIDTDTGLTSVQAGDVDSESATDGYVLTADGAGGAAWEAVSGGGASSLFDLSDVAADPDADRAPFWDDSAGSMIWSNASDFASWLRSNANVVISSATTEITASWVFNNPFYDVKFDPGVSLQIQNPGDDGQFLISVSNDFVDDLLQFNAISGASGGYALFSSGIGSVRMQQPLYIQERAAADGDLSGYGQLWIKNTTPCELWFTDDAGTDTQIV